MTLSAEEQAVSLTISLGPGQWTPAPISRARSLACFLYCSRLGRAASSRSGIGSSFRQVPGVRTFRLKEVSSDCVVQKVGTALSADWMRPSRCLLSYAMDFAKSTACCESKRLGPPKSNRRSFAALRMTNLLDFNALPWTGHVQGTSG